MPLPTIKWKASPNVSARSAPIDLVVCHDCQGSYLGSIAAFSTPEGGDHGPVSAHLVLKDDGSEVTQMVDFQQKAWHCCAFNSRSIGLEMAGFAERGFPDVEWATAANIIAYLLHAFSIPCQWSHGGKGPGFTSHFDLGKAGGGHSDPTTDPHVWAGFVKRVETAYAAKDWGATPWGRGVPGGSPIPPAPDPTQSANRGPAYYQAALIVLGGSSDLRVDGFWGPDSRAAMAKWQIANGYYSIDGELTSEAKAQIDKAMAAHRAQS